MLSARRKSDGQTVHAYFEHKRNAPFFCLSCGYEVLLRCGRNKISHFAHINPLACRFGEAESEEHRRCKQEIYEALIQERHISDVQLERPLGTVRPDISFYIGGVPVAIEIQISSLSIEMIQYRTIEYHRKGIYVLWLLLWSPKLDKPPYTPRLWERWLHTTYFGRVYYWLRGLEVASYIFEPHLRHVPKHTAVVGGKKRTVGGYTMRSKRHRTAIRGRTLNLARDFAPRERFWWKGNEITVPDAKLYIERK